MSGGNGERIHVQTRGDLRHGRFPGWEDPEGLAKIPEHHRVMALENPLSRSEDDPIRAYSVIDSRIAGRVNLIVGDVRVEGSPVQVLWGFDLLVSPHFRGRGVATKLLRCWQELLPIAVGTNINLASVGIYRKLGWTTFEVPSRALVMRSQKFLAGLSRSRIAGSLLAPAGDLLLSARRALGRIGGPATRGLVVEPWESFPTELDAALRETDRPVATHRSAAWFDWMLRAGRADSARDYHLCGVRDASGKIVGYFLFRLSTVKKLRGRFENVRVGIVRDWRVLQGRGIDPAALMLLACDQACRLGAETLVATALDDELDGKLQRLGFRSRQPLRSAFFAAPGSPLADERYHDPHAWLLTSVEADGLFV